MIRNSFLVCMLIPVMLIGQTDTLQNQLNSRDKSEATVDWLNESATKIRTTAPEKMTEYATAAKDMAVDLAYLEGEGEALLNIGISYWQRDQHDQAMQNYLEALKIFEILELPKKVASVKMNIGNTYDEIGQTTKAKTYILEALNVFELLSDSMSIVKGVLNLGVIHFYQEEYDSALLCFQNVLKYRIQKKDTSRIALTYLNLANVYEYQENLSQAIEHYRLARDFIKPEELLLINIDLGLGNALLLDGQEEEGLSILENALNLAKKKEQRKMEQFAYEALKDYFTENGNYEKALVYANLEFKLNNELRGDEIQQQIEVMNLKYEDEKKARALEKLRTKNERQQLKLLFTVAVAFSLLIVATLIVFTYRLRIRNIKLKEAELNQKLEHKSKELASYALNFIQKNELLNDLSEKVTLLKDDASQKTSAGLNRLNTLINSHLRIDQDWENFKMMFEEVHQGFFIRLKERYSELGSADLKLCALVRLNLNLKESSRVLGISSDSVKTARSRLRKKLGLETTENLVDFLIRFDGESTLRIA